MGIFDDMTSNFTGGSVDEMQERMHELHERQEAGVLDDEGRAELQQLNQQMGIDE